MISGKILFGEKIKGRILMGEKFSDMRKIRHLPRYFFR